MITENNLFQIHWSQLPNVIADSLDELEQLKLRVAQLENKPPENKNLFERLSRKEVKEQYRISYGTIHSLMRSGKLEYEKIGRKTIFKRESVEKAIKKAQI